METVGEGRGRQRLERVHGGRSSIVCNTLFIASCGGDGNRDDRWIQAWELARFVRAAEVSSIPMLLVGDCDSDPGADAVEVLLQLLERVPPGAGHRGP